MESSERSSDGLDGWRVLKGVLTKYWPVVTAICGAAYVIGAHLIQLRDEVRETRHALSSRLDVLEARMQNHIDWHRTNVGVDPEPPVRSSDTERDENTEQDEERGVRYGLLPEGETSPTAYIPAERVLDLVRRGRAGELQVGEEAELRAVMRWVDGQLGESMGDDRIRLIEICEESAFPTRFCRDAYRYNPYVDEAYELCLDFFNEARCRRLVVASARYILERHGPDSTFFEVNETGCPVPRVEFRELQELDRARSMLFRAE